MMKETATKTLEITAKEICPLLSSHCRRRSMVRLSEERCLDGSYKTCDTYQVVVVRGVGMSYPGSGGFKR